MDELYTFLNIENLFSYSLFHILYITLRAFNRFLFAVSFWVLALDHDLQIASGSIGSISVKDPAGTKVALWDQVALDEGIDRRFPIN